MKNLKQVKDGEIIMLRQGKNLEAVVVDGHQLRPPASAEQAALWESLSGEQEPEDLAPTSEQDTAPASEQDTAPDIEIVTLWSGPGWYAGKVRYAHGEQWVEEYRIGDDPDDRPDTYTRGLGSPAWYDTCPEGGER